MSARPYVLSETTWAAVRAEDVDVAVLPWGATEAHNLHLPYGTDTIHASRVAEEAARSARERGARVVVLPAVPYGVNTMQIDIALTVNMNPTTQLAVLSDIVESLERQGVDRLVIVNGHGGNDFKWMIRELQPRSGVFLCTINWWQVVDASAEFSNPGDHGGQLETSVMLHMEPTLVGEVESSGTGEERQPRIAGFREKWAWMPRRWTQVTHDTGIGDPRGASAAAGERFVSAAAARIGEFLVELAAADIDNLYE